MFYVLAGEYEFTAGREKFRAPVGTFLFIPRGIFHRFASTGDVGGRLLSLAVPGGIEDFFEEVAAQPDPSRADDVGRKHGVFFEP
jgi:quercetin dioxygenase-like cupin family protein